MMKLFARLTIALLIVLSFAATVSATAHMSPVKKTAEKFTGVIVEYGTDHHEDLNLEIRFKDGAKFTEWINVRPDIDHADHGHTEKVEYLINTNLTDKYQYRIDSVHAVEGLKFTFINAKSGESFGPVVRSTSLLAGLDPNPSAKAKVIPRSEWGANDEYNYINGDDEQEDIEENNDDAEKEDEDDHEDEIEKVVEYENGNRLLWPMEYIKDIKMIVVHHTASTNELDDPEQALRNIQYYHAVRRGWGDIGYNYIIAPDGTIYEGRKGGEKVVGGHARPVNYASIGIAVMGNFQYQEVPRPVIESLTKLITEKAEMYDLDVEDSVEYKDEEYPVLGGHRDYAATACPGLNLFATLPMLRHYIDGAVEPMSSNSEYSYIDVDPFRNIIDLEPKESEVVTVKLENAGSETWERSNTYLMLDNASFYERILDFDFVKQNKSFVASMNESRVAPGREASFDIEVEPNIKPGLQALKFVGVFNGKVKTSLPVFVPVYVNAPDLEYRVMSDDIELELDAGESKVVSVKIRNTGDVSWNLDGYQAKLGLKSGVSKVVPGKSRIADLGSSEVPPRASVTVRFKVTAPMFARTYEEEYTPLIENVGWFEGDPVQISVKVNKRSTFIPTVKALDFAKARVVALMNSSRLVASTTEDFDDQDLGPDVRVHISRFDLDETEVSGDFKMNIDNTNEGKFDRVRIFERKGSVQVSADGEIYSGTEVRLIPEDYDPLTLEDYENRPAWNTSLNDNRFRGVLEFRVIGGDLTVVNELPLELYLRGLAEISNSTHHEKIKTIIVAARSYAYHYVTDGEKFPGLPYDLDDDPNVSQKYLGYGFEKRAPNVVDAIEDTAGQVVTYGGSAVKVPYFSQSDGATRSAEEVWGWTDTPYLQSVEDSYCNEDTLLGHGVGISGCGADGMASAGFDYDEIIEYFLNGVDLEYVYARY